MARTVSIDPGLPAPAPDVTEVTGPRHAKTRRRTILGWALMVSLAVHALLLAALYPGLTPVTRQQAAEEPLAMEVLLSDPRKGTLGDDDDGDSLTPETGIPPQPAEAAAPAPSPVAPSPAAPAPREPPPSEPPPQAPDGEAPALSASPAPEPVPPSPPSAPPVPQAAAPPPRAAAPPSRPAPAAPVAPAARPRAGASAEGRDDGRTEIITGDNVVPAGPDPGHVNLPPRYPPDAARRGQQGQVTLSILVATDGSVLSADVAESSGFPALDRAAREAALKWRFRPGMRDGMAMPTTIPYSLVFRLEGR